MLSIILFIPSCNFKKLLTLNSELCKIAASLNMKNQTPKKSDRAYYLFAFRIVGDFGATIAVPAILAALLGNWLDEKYSKYPLFTVILLIIAFLATARIIQKKAKKYGKEYEQLK